MNCPNCGALMGENERFCTSCGTNVPVSPAPTAIPVQKPVTKEDLPAQLRVLSPWAYFGLQILYSIPIVGFIFLLIHTFSAGNLNRRSFARSYWCALMILGGIALVVGIIGVVVYLFLAPAEANMVSVMP